MLSFKPSHYEFLFFWKIKKAYKLAILSEIKSSVHNDSTAVQTPVLEAQIIYSIHLVDKNSLQIEKVKGLSRCENN